MDTETTRSEESFLKRFAVRFGCLFFGSYFFLFPLGHLPFLQWLTHGWEAMWKHLVIWTGTHVLRLAQPIVYEPTGSGDTLHDWVFMGLLLTLSAAVAILWSVLARARKTRFDLAAWLRVYLRYTLAAVLLSYGFDKVFGLQFSPPGGFSLTETYGQSSPMRLAWTFMGYSVPYTIFAGSLECLAGLLLLLRRTATAGAGMAAIVMTNVVVMNFCYDIPVKLHSSLYLAMALVILAASVNRIFYLFFLHRPAAPEDISPPAWQGWRKWDRWALKTLFVGYVLFTTIQGDWEGRKVYAKASAPSLVQGFYEIKTLRRNGVEVPRLYTEAQGWRWVNIGTSYLRIGLVDGSRLPSVKFEMDAAKHELTLSGTDGPAQKTLVGTLRYAIPDADHLVLAGMLDGAPIELNLEKRRDADSPLLSRGFHWITEHPYSR